MNMPSVWSLASLCETQAASGKTVNRMIHINRSCDDLLNKLEAVRLLCRETGCAQRYLSHDALNAIHQETFRADSLDGSDYHERFISYLHNIQDRDLTLGVAMTDGKGDRKLRPPTGPQRKLRPYQKSRSRWHYYLWHKGNCNWRSIYA